MLWYIFHHLIPGAEAVPYVNSLTKILLKLVKIPNEFSGKNSGIKVSLGITESTQNKTEEHFL